MEARLSPFVVIVLLLWQLSNFLRLYEHRRLRKHRKEFWERHEENIKAIRAGNPQPYPNNRYGWVPLPEPPKEVK